ncbi:carboxypeptidase M32 [Cyanobium sp. Morenito 9A2]|uniref:carboxypeptidase M32 n=1 Tax=Cyanobium sp. Morenito 9A2 TaxID=2823718 RepID=UPI0020CFB079|nr:carboxypeptidase M32 [Cyanobium sp. Morenito 9A2]MCP9849359.1 carboxypeptidase M32 [Cyanobium sp. Morenito 9A2]
MGQAIDQLRSHLHGTRLLGSIASTLYFDQNTLMPAEGSAWRGAQLALLARQLHGRQSNEAYADLIEAAAQELALAHPAGPGGDGEPHPGWPRNLELLRQDLRRQRNQDPALVGHLVQAQSRGYSLWQEARTRSDFAMFAPALNELIALRREQASQLAVGETGADGQPRSCWETLAQPFEPEISQQTLGTLFTPLRQRLPELLARVEARRSEGAEAPDALELPEALQLELCQTLLDDWGFDGRIAVLARSPHPFSCTLGPSDFRLTTRIVPGSPYSAFLATAHEWGHSLYEQGLPRRSDQWFAWPLGDATSMGVHESQSLFWECRIARSEAFARRWHPRFKAALGSDPWGSAAGLWRALNPLNPGLNRVEADELSYGLHILLRYELELALLEGDLPVEALPGEWNRLMGELLGLTPANDAEGCLQDVHWSEGLFGYFPSYLLGHLISAQLSQAMERDGGPIERRLAAGDDQALLVWLREHVHPLGRSVDGAELVERVSGAPLSAVPFLSYLEDKLNRLEAT